MKSPYYALQFDNASVSASLLLCTLNYLKKPKQNGASFTLIIGPNW